MTEPQIEDYECVEDYVEAMFEYHGFGNKEDETQDD